MHGAADGGSERHRGKNAFTLVELLVVIGVIAILAALLVSGAAGSARSDRAAPEQMTTPVPATPAVPASPAAAAPAPTTREAKPSVGATDAGTGASKQGVQHACGANACSAEGRKK